MQDIRKKHLNSKSSYPVSREITPRREGSSITHIGLSGSEERRPRFAKSDDISLYRSYNERSDEEDTTRDSRGGGKSWRKIKTLFFYVFVSSILLAIYYALTFVFDKATIQVTPNYKDVKIAMTPIQIGEKGVIPFTIATAEITKTKTLPKTMTTTIDKKASGEIIIYNNYSESPQRLVKFTRFESTGNKIYRIQESVVVPGKKAGAPGEVVARVLAESDGPSFNLDKDTFTIPGLKGEERYKTMSAKTKTSIVGGMSGSKAVVALTDLNAAKDEVAIKLRESAKSEFSARVWGSKIPVLESLTVVIEDNSKEILRGEADTYSAKGIASIATVEGSDLSKVILTGDVNKSLTYSFLPSKSITFSIENDSSILSSSTLSLLVNGNARILWMTNYETLKNSLVGKTKKEFTLAVTNDKTISSAVVNLFPPWKTSFPARSKSIVVEEKIPTYKE
jgi:hypothetical protein